VFLLVANFSAAAQVNLTTSRYNNQRTGVNSNETILTHANVNAATFGKLFSQAVDGYVFAQTLYLSNVTIGGVVHNVVYVATEHDSVYAFDADSNAGANAQPLWHTNFLSFGVSSVPSSMLPPGPANTDIIPEVGITGTPVIDLARQTLYVVAETLEDSGNRFVKKLHALDIATGAEMPGSPIVISASVTVPGEGTVTFNTQGADQRSGLLLYNGVVYIAFSAHGDGTATIRGWILGYSYDGSSFSQVFVYCSEPSSETGWGGGIWMAGQGLPMDADSNLFAVTGNGQFDTDLTRPINYGDSIIRIDLSKGPAVQDYFTPSNQATLSANDQDLGSGGIAILPDQPGPNPHLLVQAGKQGAIYVINRDNMGHFDSSRDNIVQELGVLFAAFSSPVYFNGKIYYWGCNDVVRSFTVTNGVLSTASADLGKVLLQFPGATPTISANGTSNAILWALETDAYSKTGPGGPAVLFAYDATNLSTGLLYSSSQNPSRDNPGAAVKFTVPTVANGKVYVGAVQQLSVYGVLDTTPPAIISANTATFTVGGPGSFTVTATGAPTPSLIQTGTLPNGVTFQRNGNGTATLTGTPASGTGGTYSLTFTASNGVGTAATQSFTLAVSRVNQAPLITSADSTTFSGGGSGSFTVTAAGAPTPSLTEIGTLPAGVTFQDNGNGTATVSGTPALRTGGTYSLTFIATNGVGTAATQTFTLTISALRTYTTNFPHAEDPVSEGGAWINGGTVGLDWNDCRSTAGLAFGTQDGTTNGNDSTCVVGGSWGANQTAQAVVHVVASEATQSDVTQSEEVELRLHTTITAHSIAGYAIDCSVKSSNPYMKIVRWNGPLGRSTPLGSRAIGCADGDVFKAANLGSTINVYKNGVLLLSVSDSTYSGGSPGFGFYRNGGSNSTNADFGLSSFTATDGSTVSPPDAPTNIKAAPGRQEHKRE
jgi:Putative Ig domain